MEFVDDVLPVTELRPGSLGRNSVGRETEASLRELGTDHGRSPEQIAIRWLLDQPLVATIPRSGDPQHRQGNPDVFDFSLSQDEHRRIAQLGR